MMYGRFSELKSSNSTQQQNQQSINQSMSITPISSISSSQSPSAEDATMSVSPSPVLPVSPPVLPVSPPVRESRARDAVVELLPIRIIIGSIWIMLISTFVTWDAMIYGCHQFISNFVMCVGLVGILIIVSLPIVYGILPQQTQNFKFVSLCPGIEYAFHKFDDFITCAKQAVIEGM